MLAEEEEAIAAAAVREEPFSDIADLVTSSISRQEEDLPVDPNLLSSRLNRITSCIVGFRATGT